MWDGIGSASLPVLIAKLKASNINSLSIAVLASKIRPIDAHFNTYAALEMCLGLDAASILLLGRDNLEGYEGVDREGKPIKNSAAANYLVNLLLSKETIVDEVTEFISHF